jgi:hypothetical protein
MQNNWGPYTPANTYEYPADGGQPTPLATPPQSPSGSVTNESATFNFAETITSTEQKLTNVLEVEDTQQGTPAQTSAPAIAGCSSVPWNNWNSGIVGSQGNKFS